MENNSLFPLRYRLRKTDEQVEVIAWETAEKGSRSENDWVSYIDSHGEEHVKEHLTLEWDLVIDNPLDSWMTKWEPMKLPEFDPWEQRRYELVKEYVLGKDKTVGYAVSAADEIISALKEPKKGL